MSTQYSPVSQIPNFGRAWSLTVSNPANSAGVPLTYTLDSQTWQPETMRIVFEVNILGYSSKGGYWTAMIELWNLSADMVQSFLYGQGATVTLYAGFQAGPYGVIFQGTVYQALYERVEVVDSKVTLMCYTGMKETIANFAVLRGDAQMTQAAIVAKMAAGSQNPFPIDPASQTALSKLSTTPYPRARAYFGDPHDFIDRVTTANNMQSWYGFDGLGISVMSDQNSVSTITYTPSTGILGTPQQTVINGIADGVQFRVLLDPRLKVTIPRMQVNIADSQIKQIQYVPPGYRHLLDPNGLYLVNALQFRGDSRGNMWETEIVAFISIGGLAAMIDQPGLTLDPRSAR